MNIPPRRAIGQGTAVAAAAGLSGLGSYAVVVVAAHAMDAEAYSSFAVFWSLAVVAGLGLYYPIEQETAREIAADRRAGGGLLRAVAVVAGIVTGVAALVVLLLLTPAGRAYIGEPALVPALIAVLLASAVQFPVRGLLSGGGLRGRYSLVIGAEGVARILIPVGLLVGGVVANVPFAYAVAAAAVVAVVPAFLVRDRSWLHRPAPALAAVARRTTALIVAALAIQLLLNAPVLIAGAVDGAMPLAGGILASLTIARIPVFLYGVAQVLYMPSVARARGHGDPAALRRVVVLGMGAAVAAAVLTVVVMAVAGTWLVSVVFGADHALGEPVQVLIGLGIGVFLIGQVASDTALALGAHRALVSSWVVALVAAGITAATVSDPVLRTTAPLLVGSSIAVVLLAGVVIVRLRLARPTGRPGAGR
ncbi:hypothetical protein [Agromyces sp. LHK192]|uniref:hypothetical protein n=1 Tax=Agromyces sp. LHK192 TaxID=2498704 RepID=UPI000FDC8542|nr:hypothetical protein [Agromyces sp. LHK192]